MIEKVSMLGFRVVSFKWGKTIYKYKLIPLSGTQFDYKLDISVYRNSGSEYICPQGVKHTNQRGLHRFKQKLIDWKKGNTIAGGHTIKSKLVYGCYRLYVFFFVGKIQTVEMRQLIPDYYKLYKWVIPSEFLSDFIVDANRFSIMKDAQEYLSYRYGNWRTPVEQWDFTKDDHGLRIATPNEIDEVLGILMEV